MIGLGIDAGGSATRWALADAKGILIRSGELESVDGHLFITEHQMRFTLMAARLAQAVAPQQPVAIVAGITGLTGDSAEARQAETILSAGFSGCPARVEDDLWIGYHAVFAPGEGHVVYAGTGSVGLHVRANGSLLRVGGRGMLIDDAGSAFWIGREGLNALYRRIDRGEAPGALGEALFAAIGGESWNDVRAYVYGGGRNAMAQLARTVAATNDPVALRILQQAGQELSRLALDLVGRVALLPVALQGRAADLHPAILLAMQTAAPALDITRRSADAALAAAKLAANMGNK